MYTSIEAFERVRDANTRAMGENKAIAMAKKGHALFAEGKIDEIVAMWDPSIVHTAFSPLSDADMPSMGTFTGYVYSYKCATMQEKHTCAFVSSISLCTSSSDVCRV